MAARKESVILTERIRIEEDKIKILEARKTDPARQTPYERRITLNVAVRSTSNSPKLSIL